MKSSRQQKFLNAKVQRMESLFRDTDGLQAKGGSMDEQ